MSTMAVTVIDSISGCDSSVSKSAFLMSRSVPPRHHAPAATQPQTVRSVADLASKEGRSCQRRCHRKVLSESRNLWRSERVDGGAASSDASMPACRFGRLSIPRRAASCRRCIGDSESVGGLAVDITARLQPLLALELRESIPRLWAHHTVRLTNIEALLIELHLNFTNLALAGVRSASRLRAAPPTSRPA